MLITGGAGFIGSHIAENLLRLGHNVTILDNFSTGKWENIKHLDVKVIEADILDDIPLHYDVVFHQAASKKNICMENPKRDCDVNAKGTLSLLERAIRDGVKKFIHASTGSVYGEIRGLITEERLCNPVSYYGVSKLAGERYVQVFHHLYKLNTTILRYFHVYGPRQEDGNYGGVIAIFRRRAKEGKALPIHGDGEQVRSFTHVRDVVAANIAAIDAPGGTLYNVASGLDVTVNEVAKIVRKKYPVGAIYMRELPGDIRMFEVDNREIRKELGVNFSMDFKTDLKNYLCES